MGGDVGGNTIKTQRACAFCGSDKDLTREHVWPRWAQDLVGAEPAPYVAAVEKEITRVWTASPATLTVRLVCRACNNGWMARLEHAARPVLTPLIIGERAVLSVKDSGSWRIGRPRPLPLATWLCPARIQRYRLNCCMRCGLLRVHGHPLSRWRRGTRAVDSRCGSEDSSARTTCESATRAPRRGDRFSRLSRSANWSSRYGDTG